jgi:hypothetical protein
VGSTMSEQSRTMNRLAAVVLAGVMAAGFELPARADTTPRPTGFMQPDVLLHFCGNLNDNTAAEKVEADQERGTCAWYIAGIADVLSAGGKACPDLTKLAPADIGGVLLGSIINDVKANKLRWPVPRGLAAAPYVEGMLMAAFPCGPKKPS